MPKVNKDFQTGDILENSLGCRCLLLDYRPGKYSQKAFILSNPQDISQNGKIFYWFVDDPMFEFYVVAR